MNNRTPAEVFPPGDFIREELAERGWTQDDLAKITSRPVSEINLIVCGKRGISPDTACELASAFGTSPEFWLNLENAYKLSKVVVSFEEIRQMASLFECSPVKEMEKRGWISKTDSAESLKKQIHLFYEEVDINNFRVAARASTEQGEITDEQLAWCVRCLHLAKMVPAKPFSESNIESCQRELRKLAAYPEGISKVPEVLADAGIRFVFVEPLKGTKIDGAALWIGETWDKPVIALSGRFDRIDWFWHTLGHEFSHIKHKDSYALIDVDLLGEEARNGEILGIENRANSEAADMLIPKGKLDSFILRKRPYFSKVSIIQFANLYKIHPGIVVGQLHHRLKTYSTNREMLIKIRDAVAASAMTDGWGIHISKKG